jgi:hypothetical protein
MQHVTASQAFLERESGELHTHKSASREWQTHSEHKSFLDLYYGFVRSEYRQQSTQRFI